MNDAVIFGISTAWIIANVWSVLTALIVLASGWVIARIVSRSVATLLSQRLKRDVTIGPLVGQVVRYAILFVTIIIVLGQFGVETASVLAVLGAAGLAVAFGPAGHAVKHCRRHLAAVPAALQCGRLYRRRGHHRHGPGSRPVCDTDANAGGRLHPMPASSIIRASPRASWE